MDLITVCSGFSEIAQIRADQSQTRLSERENKATKSIGGAIPGIRKMLCFRLVSIMSPCSQRPPPLVFN